MDLFARQAELRKQFEYKRVHFLLTEVATSTTFCEVANASDNPEKTKRNIANAREGYDTLMHFLPGAHFDAESKNEFDTKFAHLKSLLRDLGEEV
jgi:hypothetical protein